MMIGVFQESIGDCAQCESAGVDARRLRVVGGSDLVSDALVTASQEVVTGLEELELMPSKLELAELLRAEMARLGKPFRSLSEKWDAEERVVSQWRSQHSR